MCTSLSFKTKQNRKLKKKIGSSFVPWLAFEAKKKKTSNERKEYIIRVVTFESRGAFFFFFNLKLLRVIIKWFTFNSLTKQWKMYHGLHPGQVLCVHHVKGFAFFHFVSFRLSVSRKKEINFFSRKFSSITWFTFFSIHFHTHTHEVKKKAINFIEVKVKNGDQLNEKM